MNALNAPFRVALDPASGTPVTLTAGGHFGVYPSRLVSAKAEQLTARQIDLLRLGMAIHLADGWARRFKRTNGHRRPVVEVDLLDADFWERPETADRLKRCVDFLSGDDDWSFRFRKDTITRRHRQQRLAGSAIPESLLCLYSGGLDSAAGLAARLSQEKGRPVIAVTVRYQSQRGHLIREQFDRLRKRGLVRERQLYPFQVGAYVRNDRLRRDLELRLRETSHRCRPFLYLSVAGVAADLESVGVVEVYESGVGAVNLPLVSGGSGWRTTRSSHPQSLRLMSDLVSHVNDVEVRFDLPFLQQTKAEMVRTLGRLGLAGLARMSISCIMHPLRRGGGQRQCGYCPACVYRRHAMWSAGIREPADSYVVDLFGGGVVSECASRPFLAFRQQAARLTDLDGPNIPDFFRRHLVSTRVARSEEELVPFVDLFRRYRNEWVALGHEVRLPERAGRCLVGASGGTSP